MSVEIEKRNSQTGRNWKIGMMREKTVRERQQGKLEGGMGMAQSDAS